MSEQLPRRLAAVMFTDVVGYTAMMQEDEEATRVVRLRHREALEAAIEKHGGELIQYLGDGSLSTFSSTVRAVSAAVEVQTDLREDVPLRVGIHQGEIAFDEQGIYGDSVNVAARVMGAGVAGSVLISDPAHNELKNQPDSPTISLGQFALKNVKRLLEVHAVESAGLAVPTRDDLLPFIDSTAVYKGVTQHWPKIALGAVGAAVAAGFTVGRISGASLQSYVFAWAATTASVWFLFDKAEAAMSARSRKQVVSWLQEADLGPVVESIPAQFAALFDRVFGERHLSFRCFFRSSVASVMSVVGLYLVVFGVTGSGSGPAQVWIQFGSVIVFAALLNVIPDYLSLLETRWAIRWMGRSGRTLPILAVDALLTAVISAVIMVGFGLFTPARFRFDPLAYYNAPLQDVGSLLEAGRFALLLPKVVLQDGSFGMGIFFYSAFLTSAWLWLYVLAVIASRVLLRMNSGVGFLLRVTDVERQPFRSMGFVGVIMVSLVFALGVPFVGGVPQAARVDSPGPIGGSDPTAVVSCVGQPDAAIMTFVDANLEAEVRRELGVGSRGREDLTCGLVGGMTYLMSWGGGPVIRSLAGIQNLTNLTTLWLSDDSISDVGPLSELGRLTSLRINAATVTDISPLSGLTGLTVLGFSGNSITDVSSLAGLTSLSSLFLFGNSITDVGALAGLPSLTVLNLRDNSISDLEPLGALTNLTILLVGGTFSDLGPLAGLTSLDYLDLTNNPNLSNIQPLLDNTGLAEGDAVYLRSTSVSCTDVARLEAKGVSVVSDCG